MTTVVWFRNDLRTADNPALHAAALKGDVVPVYIWDPEKGPHHYGAAARWWLHYSLESLEARLKERGGRLIIRQGPTEQVLQDVLRETDAKNIVWNRRYDPSGIALDKAIKTNLQGQGLDVQSYNGNLVMEPWELQTKTGGPYKVFSPFWKNLISRPLMVAPLEEPACSTPSHLHSDRLEELNLRPTLNWADGFREDWQPGCDAAAATLDAYAAGPVARYHDQRNLPAVEGTSRLSPRLRFGELSPRQVWHAVAHYHPKALEDEGAEAFLREIGWREFAYHLIYHFPTTVTEPLRPNFARFPWRHAPNELRRWQQGMTGFPIVDAGMRQLWHTGWMHNRVRMIVASFLVKNLLISWQDGAEWFFDTLVDGDIASNTLGWQWAGGCGADAAPYFRIFNPMSQGEKFDPKGEYVRRWVPELASLPNKILHRPFEAKGMELQLHGVTLGNTYPTPIGEHKKARERALKAFDVVKGAA